MTARPLCLPGQAAGDVRPDGVQGQEDPRDEQHQPGARQEADRRPGAGQREGGGHPRQGQGHSGTFTLISLLTLMMLVANFANTKSCKKP